MFARARIDKKNPTTPAQGTTAALAGIPELICKCLLPSEEAFLKSMVKRDTLELVIGA